jgi:hypothetical protein
MNGIRHPYNKALYEPDGPGRAKVTTRDVRVGWFAADGHWLEGEKMDADPQLCVWISAPRGMHRMNTKPT